LTGTAFEVDHHLETKTIVERRFPTSKRFYFPAAYKTDEYLDDESKPAAMKKMGGRGKECLSVTSRESDSDNAMAVLNKELCYSGVVNDVNRFINT
jgi:hypothetical protein